MFLGWQNQYCENDYTTSKPSTDSMQSLLNYQSFHRTRTTNFTIYIKTQKTPNSLSNLEKEKWSWRNQPFWFQTILKGHSHQDSMVLGENQKYRPMEQDTKPIDKLKPTGAPFIWQRRQTYTMEKTQSLQWVVLGKLDSYM